jgi:hypothetical protein
MALEAQDYRTVSSYCSMLLYDTAGPYVPYIIMYFILLRLRYHTGYSTYGIKIHTHGPILMYPVTRAVLDKLKCFFF